MTSPSLKNHPTTAQPKATRSNRLSLWQKCLAGALCLMVSGSIPANDQEIVKPLDRLKLRSPRQRWRELRGEWKAAPEVDPQTPVSELPKPEMAPLAVPKRNPAAPIPTAKPHAVSGSTTEEARVLVPVPAPMDAGVEARPSDEPSTDIGKPSSREGSFGDVSLETRVATPRVRKTIPLPHWPFEDDLDLVPLPPPDDAPPAAVDPKSSIPVALELFSPTADEASPEVVTTPEQPVDSIPIQVAQVPAAEVATAPVSIPEAPAVEAQSPQPDETITSVPLSKPAPVYKLKSIQDIQPFYDYLPEGAESKTANAREPIESELVLQGSLERNPSIIPIYWQASNVSHNPLYFEDSGLERNGHSFPDMVQPFVSVGKFGTQVVALPYSMALDPMWKRETPLGQYRPGEYAPQRHLAVPINGEAAVVAAATYTGLFYLIP
jgi:hypothetical protein